MTTEDPLAGEVSIQASLDASGLKLASKSRAIAALDRLVGSIIDIPGSFIEAVSKRRRTKDEIQEQLARSVAQARIEGATELEHLRQRAALHDETQRLQKQMNREEVAVLAIEDLRESPPKDDHRGQLDEDWLNKFVRFSEEASSERLKSLFAKILAGEIRKPESFSPATLRAVSELTQPLAEEFSWAWSKSVGENIWRGPEFESGSSWTKLTNLRDYGLISPVDSAVHQPPFNPVTVPQLELINGSLWQIGPHDDVFLWVAMNSPVGARLNVVKLTRIGLELSSILPRPDYGSNLRAVAEGFPKTGVAWIKLIGANFQEVLWRAP